MGMGIREGGDGRGTGIGDIGMGRYRGEQRRGWHDKQRLVYAEPTQRKQLSLIPIGQRWNSNYRPHW